MPEPLSRITRGPEVMGGRADILALYPYLEEDDIREALAYAAWRVEEVEIPLRRPPIR